MAALTAARRKKLRKTQFASPKGSGGTGGRAPSPGLDSKRNQYPVDTRRRAANAKARATQAYNRGRLTRSARDRIHAKANRVLRRRGRK